MLCLAPAVFFASAVLILVSATAASVFVMSVSMSGEHGTPLPDWCRKILMGPLPATLGLQYAAEKASVSLFLFTVVLFKFPSQCYLNCPGNLGRCISLLLPRLPKLPFEYCWLNNFGNLDSNTVIHCQTTLLAFSLNSEE